MRRKLAADTAAADDEHDLAVTLYNRAGLDSDQPGRQADTLHIGPTWVTRPGFEARVLRPGGAARQRQRGNGDSAGAAHHKPGLPEMLITAKGGATDHLPATRVDTRSLPSPASRVVTR